jgi:4-amino-4-deoxychorismate lyase
MHELPFDAPAVERGVGFFETVLLVGRRAALWEAHVERLLGTLARHRLPAPTRDEIAAAAARAVAGTHGEEQTLRLTWLAVGQQLDARDAWRLDASTRAIALTTIARRGGSHAVTLPRELARDTPGVKSTSYLGAVLGLREAMRRGADEGLFVDAQGAYLEGTAVALVAWRGGRLLAPHDGALASVTAAAFIGRQSVERGAIRQIDLRAGTVVLGSLTRAAPLLSIDGAACEVPAAMTSRIREFNDEMLETATPL